ncbi:hypothetical protein CLV78_110150 [Aliiruegeria haliotis]|uniref:Uncharacterized protein n=1 Tax=Aliiruegeria haliotis TaxID=1280846 RepID=A0A2T0RJB2_9RHOB|nr:hypothetical protein CLV78_110150 [Aliiruegeria haliotis]
MLVPRRTDPFKSIGKHKVRQNMAKLTILALRNVIQPRSKNPWIAEESIPILLITRLEILHCSDKEDDLPPLLRVVSGTGGSQTVKGLIGQQRMA